VDNDRGAQLLEFDGTRRFADLIFDHQRTGKRKSGLWHIEIQSKYSSKLLLRMADYRVRIHRRFGWVHLTQTVVFLRRPPRRVLDRLEGMPCDLGYLWVDMTRIGAREYLALGTPMGAVMAVISRVEEGNLIARWVVEALCRVSDPELRAEYLNAAMLMAGLRPDKVSFLQAMEKTLESIKALVPGEEWEQALRYSFSGVYKKGKKRGREEGIKLGRDEGIKLGRDEGIKLGRDEEKAEMIKNMAEMGIEHAVIARAARVTLEELATILAQIEAKGGRS
jgi:hypothetical protein